WLPLPGHSAGEISLAATYCARGSAHARKGDFSKASQDYQKAVEVDPTQANYHSAVGWLRATCPEPGVRNGRDAVRHAWQACVLTSSTNHTMVATLAAALAENGQFDQAVVWQKRAMELAPVSVFVSYRARLELYLAQRPYREENGTVATKPFPS